MALLGLMTDAPEEARKWARQLLQVDANSRRGNFALGAAGLVEVRVAWQKAGLGGDFSWTIPNAGLRARLKAQYLPMVDEAIQALRKSVTQPEQDGEQVSQKDDIQHYGLAYAADLLHCRTMLDPGGKAAQENEAAAMVGQLKDLEEGRLSSDNAAAMLGVASTPRMSADNDPPPAEISDLTCAIPETAAVGELHRLTPHPLLGPSCRK
jgi:hypothetical protein